MRHRLLSPGSRSPFTGLCLLVLAALACDRDVTGPEDKRIGPGGGTAVLADGAVRLFVPPGALSEDVWFTVTPAHSVPALDFLVPGSSWEIGPPGTTFSRPTTLTITYDPGGLPGGIGEGGLGVFRVDGSDWSLLAHTSANPGSHTASGEVRGLGRFGVSGLSVSSMEVSPNASHLEPGGSATLSAIPVASNGRSLEGRPVTWSSSDETTATVDGHGSVTALAEGTASITAVCEGLSATATITVTIPVASVDVSPASALMNPGQTLQLVASAKDIEENVLSGREVVWSSSDESVASVNGSGLVTTVGVGSVTVSAAVAGRYGTATIGVHSSLSVATSSLADGVEGRGYNQTLAAMGGDGTYTWFISAGTLPSGLSLETLTGVVSGTPTIPGKSTFTVRVVSAGQVATKEIAIDVAPVPVESVSVLPHLATLIPSETQQFTVVAKDASGQVVSGRSVVWESSDDGVASVSPSGLVTAKEVGTTTITATVGGRSGWASATVNNLLSVSDSALAPGVVGQAFDHRFTVVGGDGRNTWTILAGGLPVGLTLNPGTGEISGTPSARGTSSFIVQVTSGDGQSATVSLSIVIHELLEISTGSLADGVEAVVYFQTLLADGGEAPYAWSVSADTLPTGLSLDETLGVISGTPVFEGMSSFTVEVNSSDGQVATSVLSITVYQEPVTSISVTPSAATTTVGQTLQLTATPRNDSGAQVYGRTVFWISSDPSVATVDIDGLVTGAAVGSSTVTATVEGVTDMATITVYELLEIVTNSLANGVVGEAYTQTLAATGGDGTYGWTMTSGALPAGITLDGSTGVISGTPAAAGVATFIIQAISGGQSATSVLTISIG